MPTLRTRLSLLVLLALGLAALRGQEPTPATVEHPQPPGRWTVEAAQTWYAAQPWLVGCNFIPSTAVNQLEMWQADTFDPETIGREVGWAADLGFNTLRVYLHDLAYLQDPKGFLDRIDRFLAITEARDIRPILVFFDDVWFMHPKPGKQPEPFPGVHNSGWLESPGFELLQTYPEDPKLRQRLRTYVQAVIRRFARDDRVLMWDLYNEPGGNWSLRDEEKKVLRTGQVGDACLPLLRDVYAWAREVAPSQPLTTCYYHGEAGQIALHWADIVTFHNYQAPAKLRATIEQHRGRIGERPLFCTEYMARTAGSRFETCLPVFAEYGIGAINWGLVAGKTNTLYSWGTCRKPGKLPEPDVWFSDILRADGSPYSDAEVEFLREFLAERRAR